MSNLSADVTSSSSDDVSEVQFSDVCVSVTNPVTSDSDGWFL